MRTRHSNMLAMAQGLQTKSEPKLVSHAESGSCVKHIADCEDSTTGLGSSRRNKKLLLKTSFVTPQSRSKTNCSISNATRRTDSQNSEPCPLPQQMLRL